jgi:hypothetical protein
VEDPESFAAVCLTKGLVDLHDSAPEPTAHRWLRLGTERELRLRAIWQSKPWTLQELSAQVGLSVSRLGIIKRTAYREFSWITVKAGPHQNAYQLGDQRRAA